MANIRKKTILLLFFNCILFILVFRLTLLVTKVDMTEKITEAKSAITVAILKATAKPLCQDCNIILISLDTLSANHLPCYGYSRNTAPNLCQYAKNNIFFSNASANATFTLPSHVSLFTGLLPSQHRVNKPNIDALNPTIPFLPDILQQKGYKTYFYMPQTDIHLPIKLVYNRGINEYHTATEPAQWMPGLHKLKENALRGQKTFLFLHTYHVHSPYLIGNKPLMYAKEKVPGIPTNEAEFSACTADFITYLKTALKADIDSGYWGENKAPYQNLLAELNEGNINHAISVCSKNDGLTYVYRMNYFYRAEYASKPDQVKFVEALYDQKIRELDSELQSVFSYLQTNDLDKKTIIVLTADHGEEFMEHGFLNHITLYNSNVKIPLIMHVPGQAARRIDSPAQTVDIMPTVLDLIGINHAFPTQGVSLSDSLIGILHPGKLIIGQINSIQQMTISNDRYKLFARPLNGKFVSYELYDENSDPAEKNNLIFSHPAESDQLLTQLMKIIFKK